jgi:hypothetical protein
VDFKLNLTFIFSRFMNFRLKILLCILILVATIWFPEIIFSQNPLKRLDFENPKQKSLSIPFKFINNLIVLPVIINNSDTLNFILDTGITTTMITELAGTDSLVLNFAREIHLKGLGIGEALDGLHSYGNEINIKGISGQNQDIYVILNNAFQLSARMGMPIHGILGYSVFSNFIIFINYESKQISFYRPDRFKYKKRYSKYTSLPLILNDNKPYVNLCIIDDSGNAFTVKLIIDTGASHAIWLDGKSVPGFKIPEGSKETYLGTGLNGEVFGLLGRLHAIDMSGNFLNDVIVSFPDSASISNAAGLNQRNGSLGSEILKRFNIIIDYPNQKISLKPNSYFKSDFIQNLSGMEIIAPYPGLRIYVVEGIRLDSPASRSGLIKGDVIQTINGLRSEKIELSDIYEVLQNQPGKKITLSFMRNGELMNTTMRLEKFI